MLLVDNEMGEWRWQGREQGGEREEIIILSGFAVCHRSQAIDKPFSHKIGVIQEIRVSVNL